MSPKKLDSHLSFQVWGLRHSLVKDFSGTIERVAAYGYDGVEMCSPNGYRDIGLAPLTVYTAQELSRRIAGAGLYCKSCHFGRWEFKGDNAGTAFEFANTLGLKDIVVSAGISENDPLDMWKEVAEDINNSGLKAKKAGFQLVYHNSGMGPVVDGLPHYEHVMNLLEPELVKMEFQIADIDRYVMEDYIVRYKGRFSSLHMLDWSTEINGVTAIGYGVINWKSILAASVNAGLSDHGFVVELDSANPFEDLKKSYNYLRNIEIPC
jgi:sugar phosphate isomerase/epimerase